MNAAEIIARMPKAELHLHLEGTIGPETLWAIARRNHVALPVGSLEELRRLYAFEDFDRFLHLWMAMCRCFRTEADYAQMVDAFVDDCRRQNIRYVEAHFTPYNHERFGFGARRALDIVTRRLEAAEREGGPVVRLITDIPSESVPESGPFTVALLEEEAHPADRRRRAGGSGGRLPAPAGGGALRARARGGLRGGGPRRGDRRRGLRARSGRSPEGAAHPARRPRRRRP
jgi:hypothetical protein